MSCPHRDAATGKPIDLDAVKKSFFEGLEHDHRVMDEYTARGIITGADMLEEAVRETPDALFIESVETAEKLTYREVGLFSNRVARWAESRGLGCGDVVALMMENHARFVPTWFGLAKLGITIACINTHLRHDLLSHAVELSRARVAVVDAQSLPAWRDSPAPAIVAEGGHALETWVSAVPTDAVSVDGAAREADLAAALPSFSDSPVPRAARAAATAEDALFYIYTSGTTGKSKAARFSHRRFIGAGVTWTRHMRLTAADRYYCTLPLFHGNGGVVAVSAVVHSRAALVVRRRFSASNFISDVRRLRCTATIYIGEIWRYVTNQPRREDDADTPLRVAAGNGLRADIWEEVTRRFGLERIVEHYGQTEMPSAHPRINSYNVVGACGFIPLDVLGSLGTEKLVAFDVENDRVARNAAGFCEPVGVGAPGEAIVRLDGPYSGYTSDEATSRVIYRDVFEAGDTWYHSGDLLRYDQWGFVYFVDRAGDSFRWKGENVSTNEVCEVLGRCPAVAEANVYGVRVPHTEGKIGMAAVLLNTALGADGALSEPDALHAVWEHAAAELPSYARPAFLRVRSTASEQTATFKFKKYDYAQQAFDADAVRSASGGADRLFISDPAQRTFVPLTEAHSAAIAAGEMRL